MANKNNLFKVTFFLGIFLFGFLIYKIGPSRIYENIKKLTWIDLTILFSLRCAYWILRTLIWKKVCFTFQESFSFSNLFSARMVGHTVSYLTPASYFGGEAFRAISVSSPNKKKVLASVIVDKTIEIIAAVAMTLTAVVILAFQISIPAEFKYLSMAGIIIVIIFIILVFSKQKKGFFIWIVQGFRKIRLKFSYIEKRKTKIQETDKYISDFYRKNKKEFYKITAYYFLLHMFWVCEIHLTMVFIGGQEASFIKSFLIVSLGTIVFFLPSVPASLGTYEAAYTGLFVLMGFSSDFGISVTLLRRVLALFWAGYGLFIIGTQKIKGKTRHIDGI